MADSDYVKTNFRRYGIYDESVSATSPTSGVLTAESLAASSLSGPWLVETQTLEIDYVRVPAAGLTVATKSVTLSGAALTYGSTAATRLVATVRASYSRDLDYTTYTTSSYQQPQLFELNSVSADPNGTTYGTVAEAAATVGAGLALGPMGSILTLQPFYRRTLYNNETLVASSVSLATFSLSAGPNNPWTVSENQLDYLTDYEFWKDQGCVPGTQRFRDRPMVITNTWHGTIVGSYAYTKESALFISNWIDTISDYLTTSYLYPMPPVGLPWNYTVGLPEYSKMRHKY